MNQASNASGTTNITMLPLDDSSSNGDISLYGTPSLSSRSSTLSPNIADSMPTLKTIDVHDDGTVIHQIYNYKLRKFVDFKHVINMNAEEVCLTFCQKLNIVPTTRLLFGLRAYDSREWCPPGRQLRSDVRYCFRIRFKVPALDRQLQPLDPQAYEYLYNQMRFDMVNEEIPEIRYPAKKDNVLGLGMVDMCIDYLEKHDTVQHIEANCERYLPRRLMREHKLFAKRKIRKVFRQFRAGNHELIDLKWNYVHTVHSLAPNYLMETYTATVDYIPVKEEPHILQVENVTNRTIGPLNVIIKLDLYDPNELCIKIAREQSEIPKWIVLAKLDDIYTLYTEGENIVRMEIIEFGKGYRMQFNNKYEMESFITYLSGYIRLTTSWMLDLCVQYVTPSLQELKELRCHGPIGGSYSFQKIREKQDKCGSYIVRQCEKEYNVYYIDMNMKSKTETFKITKDEGQFKWTLNYNEKLIICDKLHDLVKHIKTGTDRKLCIPPTDYEKPPILLICLPKNQHLKKNEAELSASKLQKMRPQLFDPKEDLQWYKNSQRECDNGKITRMRADWKQKNNYKDVPVTLKVLKEDKHFLEFTKLTDTWSKIYSPQIIKLYGFSLSTPYTMVLEHAKFGPLNEFLLHLKEKVTIHGLLNVVHSLVLAIVDLHQKYRIVHGYIRCANLFVTKFDAKSNILETKLGDQGFPRDYQNEDLPWIPMEYYKNKEAAKSNFTTDHWAFATTVWEIFARGKPITVNTPEGLHRNKVQYGGILESPDPNCPEDIYKMIMDGWSPDPEKRFKMPHIFESLSLINESLRENYETLDNSEEIESYEETLNYLQNGKINQQLPLNSSNFDETSSVLQMKNAKLVYKKKIGEGHYGTVYLGELRYETPFENIEKVAIKTLKSFLNQKLNDDFMREIKIMESLDHPNIVKIKQWVKNPILIIMEYIECGSFLVYLSSRKPNLTNEKLLDFALDIAKGMEYLGSKKVIHRDLAARNILVDNDCVKISDFGLAQMANSDGYYLAQSDREIPIKWYAPESIKTSKFSFQSDVWSYGVTLFEMFSRGEVPNLASDTDLSHIEFLNRLEKGERLHKPPICPDSVYKKLMLPCWRENPKSRPNFKDLINEIQSIKNEYGESI